MFKFLLLVSHTQGLKHREERVVGGELKATASPFDMDKDDEDPQVLYDKV